MINLIVSRYSTHGLLLCFILLHISNSSVSASLVGHVLYSVDLMSVICIPHILFMVYRYIYSRYSCIPYTLPIVSFPSFLNSHFIFKSLLKVLQPELLFKVVTNIINTYHYLTRRKVNDSYQQDPRTTKSK